MQIIALKLLGLVGLLIPCVGFAFAAWRTRWRSAPAADCALASLLTLPLGLLVAIVLLGSVPLGRPLTLLPWVQLALSGAALAGCWWLRVSLANGVQELLRGGQGAWRESDWVPRLALCVGVLAQACATLYGAWNTPWSWDEFSYHLPQAVQPYQDGRLGKVQCNLIWADSYPRGVELLYYWTLALTGRDAGFHPVNATFGWLFLLAVYVAGRRLGLDAGSRLLAVGLTPTAPIFWYLGVIGYIDLSVGAALACLIALALPERGGGWSWGSAVALALCSVLALWMKFPTIALIGACWAARSGLQIAGAVRARRKSNGVRPRPGFIALIGLGGLTIALAAIPYVRTYLIYGSPVYPVRLKVGSFVVFDGPMDTGYFGRMNDQSIYRRYSAYWSNWHERLSTDTPGQNGPLFTVLLLGSALAVTFLSLQRREIAWLLLCGAMWLVVVLPEHHVPRYALYALLPAALCAARVATEFGSPNARRAWSLALLTLAGLNLGAVYREHSDAIRWQLGFGVPLLTEARNRPIVDLVVHAEPFAATPETRRALYELMRDGETLVAAIGGHQGLLHDYKYRYRVEHRPARPWHYRFPPGKNLKFGDAEAPTWLATLLREGIETAIVYSGSAEDRALQSSSDYKLVYEQAPSEANPGIRIYRRGDLP